MTHSISLLMLASLLGINIAQDIPDGVATVAYVDESVGVAISQANQNSSKLDRLLVNQTIEQIEKILRFKCMNPGDQTMDQTLRDLEADYRELTGAQYQRPSCEYLVDSR